MQQARKTGRPGRGGGGGEHRELLVLVQPTAVVVGLGAVEVRLLVLTQRAQGGTRRAALHEALVRSRGDRVTGPPREELRQRRVRGARGRRRSVRLLLRRRKVREGGHSIV